MPGRILTVLGSCVIKLNKVEKRCILEKKEIRPRLI